MSTQQELVERYKMRTFYSKESKRLFLIPDYYTTGTGMLHYLIQNLNSVKDYFKQEFNIEKLYSREIRKSKWCRDMWLFQCSHSGENLPDFVRIVDQDMWGYIQ